MANIPISYFAAAIHKLKKEGWIKKMNKDKLLVEEMTRVLEFAKYRKLKNGKHIEINIINKHKDGWSESRETFKNVDKAVKFLLDED